MSFAYYQKCPFPFRFVHQDIDHHITGSTKLGGHHPSKRYQSNQLVQVFKICVQDFEILRGIEGLVGFNEINNAGPTEIKQNIFSYIETSNVFNGMMAQ